MTDEPVPPLAGFTVGITAARRADELGALLVRKGAAVRYGPAIRIVPLADDTDLHAATMALLADPVDAVVATTGIGFRGWLEAAEGWGVRDDLLATLHAATLLARGPKARGAIRAAGLHENYSPASESSAELLDHLLTAGVAGSRIALQLHGEPLPWFVDALRAAQAHVVEIPVYRWVGPADPEPLDRLLGAAVDGAVDALLFTSAPAAASVLATARHTGRSTALADALRERVLACCVGPITAGPLLAQDIPVVQPGRARLGALARTVAEELTARAARLPVGGHLLEVRGHAALVDGRFCPLSPAPRALLGVLAERPGRVVSRRELAAALPDGGDEHAVESAIARLRGGLGTEGMVRTVVKRGYRLATDPHAEFAVRRAAAPAGEGSP